MILFLSSGTISRDRDSALRFALSAEEVGLLLDQLPKQQAVTLVRQPTSSESMVESSTTTPHKVCSITPLPETSTVEWKIDFEVDGVGGQVVQPSVQGPMEVTMQAGEVQAVLAIMRCSLPALLGWAPLQDMAVQKSIQLAIKGGNPSGDSY